MKKSISFTLLFCLALSMTSCELIGDIFQAGMAVGIFIVIAVVLFILWLINKFRKKE